MIRPSIESRLGRIDMRGDWRRRLLLLAPFWDGARPSLLPGAGAGRASPRLRRGEPQTALDAILPPVEALRDEFGVPVDLISRSVAEVARLATTVLAEGAGGRGRPPSAVLGRPEVQSLPSVQPRT